jgi:hypothetical protein
MSKTSCKTCIFAKYDDITQFGCECGRLDVLRKNKIDVYEAFDKEREFFTLDTYCLFYRSPDWLEKSKEKDLTKLANFITENTRLRYVALIWTSGNIQDVDKTVDSLLENIIPPQEIIILNRYENPIITDDLCLLMETKKIKWKIQNPTEQTNLPESVDLAIHNLQYSAYFVIDAGDLCGSNDISKINDRLNLGNFIFSIIEYGNNKGLYNYKIHKNLSGNKFGKTLKEKVLESETEKEWPQTIFQFSTLETIEV